MPTISRFYGIDITMRYRGEHPPPHLHAEYAGHKASFDIGTLTMKGSMPPKARGLIVEWAAIHEARTLRGLAKGRGRLTFDRDRGPKMNKLQSVLSVKIKTGFILEITFEDGKTFPLDFKPWIDSETGWLFDPLKDPAYFARAFVHGGALEWPNGLDICSDGLRAWCELGSIPLPVHH